MSRDAKGRFSSGSGPVQMVVDATGLTKVFEKITPALRSTLRSKLLAYAYGLQSHIRADYLSGSPLHRRSDNLSSSINVAPITEAEHSLSTSVGTNVPYAAVHELGLTVDVPAHSRTISMAFGKSIDPVTFLVRAHTAAYPKRAFLAPSVNDTRNDFNAKMDEAVREALAEAQNAA